MSPDDPVVRCSGCGAMVGVIVSTGTTTGLLISLAGAAEMAVVVYRLHGKCLLCGHQVHWDDDRIVEHRRLRRVQPVV